MKKSEIALIVLIVSVAAFATYFLVNTFIGKAALQPTQVEKVEKISEQIVQPSSLVFNKEAINPTVKVKIGDQSGRQPFTINQ